MPSHDNDTKREITTAGARKDIPADDRYRSWHPGNLFISNETDRVLVELLRRNGQFPLDGKTILEVGCGSGKKLAWFLARGARAADLHGIDVQASEIATARSICPSIDFRTGDAQQLPYDDDSMDIAFASTSFSSMVDPDVRLRAAAEMRRVLRPTGIVVWYDFWITHGNPNVVSIGLGEVRRLFEAEHVDARRVTLAPPISRRVAGRSWFVATLLNAVPLLRSHWMAVIRPGPLPARSHVGELAPERPLA